MAYLIAKHWFKKKQKVEKPEEVASVQYRASVKGRDINLTSLALCDMGIRYRISYASVGLDDEIILEFVATPSDAYQLNMIVKMGFEPCML